MKKIYVKFRKPQTVRQFLKKLFTHKNWCGYIVCCETFNDPECTDVQCAAGKMRSFDDILSCVKTYYPSVSDTKVFLTLLTLKVQDNKKPYFFACRDIRKINIFYNLLGNTYFDAIGRAKYNSKYSWKELLEKAEVDETKYYQLRNNPK